MRAAAAVIGAAPLCANGAAGAAAREGDLVIADVTVISPERSEPLEHAYVLVRDGKIAAVSEEPVTAGRTIEGRGKFLTPGLMDSHVHLGDVPGMWPPQEAAHPAIAAAARRQEPRSYLYFGFTTVVDLIGNPEGAARWNSAADRPDAVFCGGAPIANGYPMVYAPEDARFRIPLSRYFLYDPRQVDRIPGDIDPAQHTPEAVVAHMAEDGAACVKIFYETGFGEMHDLPTPTLPMAKAVVEAAHARGLPVLIHANSVEAQQFALAAGVDIIAHGLWNGFTLDDGGFSEKVTALLDEISARGPGYQPTFQVLHGLIDLFDEQFLARPALQDAYPPALLEWYRTEEGGWFRERLASGFGGTDPRRVFGRVIGRLERVVPVVAGGGATLLFGSDTPSAPTYANPPGLNGRWEMRRWIEAGIDDARLFRAMTIDNARAFGLGKRIGSIQPGKVAHLLLLGENPLDDAAAWDTIETVILAGRPIPRGTLSALHAAAP